MYDKDRSSVSKDGLIRIYVLGEALPFPGKTIDNRGKFSRLVDQDYRTRKSKITGETERYDNGYKRRWMANVADSVDTFMFDKNIEPFPRNHPVAIGCLFFLKKSKTCKLEFPSQDPDWDNLDYAINNALKNTRTNKKGRAIEGKYPDGVIFYDDNQPVWRIQPDGMLWADKFNPPGVLISIRSAFDLRDDIAKWVTTEAITLL